MSPGTTAGSGHLLVTSFPLQFRGSVACRSDGEGPLGLILTGETEDRPGEPAQLAFAAVAPADLPDAVENACVEQLGPRRYRISSSSAAWVVEGVAHLHRDIGRQFRVALPGRAVPWRKRVFWYALLALAGNKRTRGLLLRSRS